MDPESHASGSFLSSVLTLLRDVTGTQPLVTVQVRVAAGVEVASGDNSAPGRTARLALPSAAASLEV